MASGVRRASKGGDLLLALAAAGDPETAADFTPPCGFQRSRLVDPQQQGARWIKQRVGEEVTGDVRHQESRVFSQELSVIQLSMFKWSTPETEPLRKSLR